MINELRQLSDALSQAGIIPPDWHKDLQPLPKVSQKKPCYKIVLGENGKVLCIQTLSAEVADHLRKWEPSNGNSFPGFNIQPLFRITDEEQKKLFKKWREGKEALNLGLLKAWCAEENNRNWEKNIEGKIHKCLKDIPSKLLKVCGDIPEEFIAVKKVAEFATQLEFQTALAEYIWAQLAIIEDVVTLLPLLVHAGSQKQVPERDRGAISVFLDVQDWQAYPVAHEKITLFLNACLFRQNACTTDVGNNLDAYGLHFAESDKQAKLPSVRLPVLGDVTLRAMNKESLCQKRYGTIDAASFSVGQESRKRVKGALEWLGDKSREGYTWGRVDAKQLLFAYPATVPPSPLKLAGLFGARTQEDIPARFAEYAKDVILQLKCINRDLNKVELRVFSLRKMDKARTKVVFHRSYCAQRLADAATKWQAGCDNIPSIRLPTWGEKKGETVIETTKVPFPLQIGECLNRVWKMDGSKEEKDRIQPDEVQVISKTAGIELLLDEQVVRYIPHMLSVALQNGKGLLLSLGSDLHKGKRISLQGFNQHKQWLPSIIGLLLLKLNVKKENYMTNVPYLVGNMLKVSDDLHALYCKEVRGGKMPPQLLGNAIMVAALESPVQALSQLALRIAPYLAWARTNSSDSVGLSRYFLKCYGEIEVKLRGQQLPQRMDDAERAHLLLGYLAASEKTQSNNEQQKGE